MRSVTKKVIKILAAQYADSACAEKHLLKGTMPAIALCPYKVVKALEEAYLAGIEAGIENARSDWDIV